ncbi:MAG: sigma-70 family RNA polymerase sigma factor [Chloroflexi bacterium]|nr:sigma-70 family RNA polymerase sigma factor [Chloroflexota bacterium]
MKRWESFVFWLYRIARRRCIDWLRIRARRVDREFIEDQDSKVMDAHSLNSYRDSRSSEFLGEALDSLPELHREVLMLHYFGGMNSREIARAIGASPGAIRMRLSRARAQLREEIVVMMNTAFEGQRIPAGFTLRIVEAVKHIKIHPMPKAAGLPWGLSLAAGIIVAVISLSPNLSISKQMAVPTSSPLPAEVKALKIGEIPVDILKIDKTSFMADSQEDGPGGKTEYQNTFSLAPSAQGDTWTELRGFCISPPKWDIKRLND